MDDKKHPHLTQTGHILFTIKEYKASGTRHRLPIYCLQGRGNFCSAQVIAKFLVSSFEVGLGVGGGLIFL